MKKKSGDIRKAAALSLAAALLLSSVPAIAAGGNNHALQSLSTDKSNKTVPLRFAAAKTGASVSWDEKNRIATVTKDGSKLLLFVDEGKALLDGKPFDTGQAVTIIQYQTHIPEDLLSRAFAVKQQEEPVALFIEAAANHNYKEAYTSLSPALKKAIPSPEGLQAILQGYDQLFGKVEKELDLQVTRNSVHTNTAITYKTAHSAYTLILRAQADGLVDDFSVFPPNTKVYQKPAYDKGDYVQERKSGLARVNWHSQAL
ncbi:copper amine oxidase N-terminal domain-containing protein [Paenibacillus sp. GCM10012307]|uniref:Copper amine oxidase N-terminal domain-containing protein n=1 Tax=Paenibacillus roseus TaxID=2798579 RepID=A0A934J314_9BACL|nr:copper amine oxidase N-terminal domain-containing protein [Paenibacillus roseus]MBJ6360694.1 copper amine oxidase N-terminal domain-containing protein [Paenibacillus roseus]